MKRLSEAWFEFKGVRSTDMGVLLRQMPTRFVPGRSVTRRTVAGRDGSILTGEGGLNDVSVRIECSVPDGAKVANVLGWLSGSGALRFSDEPELVYDACVEKEYSRASIISRCEGQRFTVAWTCAPLRRQYIPAETMIFRESGEEFTALGSYFALPRLAIYGSGAFSVTIAGGGHSSTMFFSGVPSGGILVDSEKMDAMTMDGSGLLNSCVLAESDEFFRIYPGMNTITWITGDGDEAGSIVRIALSPGWRYL